MIGLRNVESLSALLIRSPQIFMRSSRSCIRHTVLGNTRHVQVMSQNFVAPTMADPYCCCEVVYRLGAVGTNLHCNLFNLVFSTNSLWQISKDIILQTVSPSVPPKHNTATKCIITKARIICRVAWCGSCCDSENEPHVVVKTLTCGYAVKSSELVYTSKSQGNEPTFLKSVVRM